MCINKKEGTTSIQIDSATVIGTLTLVKKPAGIVLFAHGSGSSRFSPRNRYVAQVLQQAGFATLLLDLLTEEEDEIYENRFNIDLLTTRLWLTTKWVQKMFKDTSLPVGYFGASTGVACALKAAADLGSQIRCIVSRGGRPDLAENELYRVKSPTLLIVGGDDTEVLALNREAYRYLNCPKKLAIVKGATHLFEEPGALEEVTHLAADWFKKYLYARPIRNRKEELHGDFIHGKNF